MMLESLPDNEEAAIRLDFGLYAIVRTSDKAREIRVRRPAEKKCRCGRGLEEKDMLVKTYDNVKQAVYYFCRTCDVYFDPETRQRLGSCWWR
jgi:hypothetical protein